MIKVLPLDSKVQIRGGIEGWITTITLRKAEASEFYIEYEVRWWNGGELKNAMFTIDELQQTCDTEPLKLGF